MQRLFISVKGSVEAYSCGRISAEDLTEGLFAYDFLASYNAIPKDSDPDSVAVVLRHFNSSRGGHFVLTPAPAL